MSTKDSRFEIRFSGSGGQGLILAGIILAEAAGIHDGKEVAQTQSYGPEARGGASRADVVISEEKVAYPKTMALDVLLALTQEACDSYAKDLKPDGLLIADDFGVRALPEVGRALKLPLVASARDIIGLPIVANIISLGVIVGLTGIVTKDAIHKAVEARAPKAMVAKNIDALELGFQMAKKAK